jgi:hypothetical protein
LILHVLDASTENDFDGVFAKVIQRGYLSASMIRHHIEARPRPVVHAPRAVPIEVEEPRAPEVAPVIMGLVFPPHG